MTQGAFGGEGVVVAVARSAEHSFSKTVRRSIELLRGEGVLGDAHFGVTVQHRSRVARDPTQPNLRQVHLIHAELHDELRAAGFVVTAGQLGENVVTRGIGLLDLPTGTRLLIGRDSVIEITGLRNPCVQIDDFQAGLLSEVVSRDADGGVVRKAGVMGVVVVGGEVRPGDPVVVHLPPEPHRRLSPV